MKLLPFLSSLQSPCFFPIKLHVMSCTGYTCISLLPVLSISLRFGRKSKQCEVICVVSSIWSFGDSITCLRKSNFSHQPTVQSMQTTFQQYQSRWLHLTLQQHKSLLPRHQLTFHAVKFPWMRLPSTG